MKKIAFTLAEVLLTLTIVGVVSALTVPNIIGAVDEKELQAQAKKAYNTLQTAINMQYAMTRKTPADVSQSDIVQFLTVSSEGWGVEGNAVVLKTVTLEHEEDAYHAQLPDGQMLITPYQRSISNCRSGLALPCRIMVDLNGSDGPNFNMIEMVGSFKGGQNSAGMNMKEAEYDETAEHLTSYDKRYRDYVFFEISGLDVRPMLNHPNTRRYFMGRR